MIKAYKISSQSCIACKNKKSGFRNLLSFSRGFPKSLNMLMTFTEALRSSKRNSVNISQRNVRRLGSCCQKIARSSVFVFASSLYRRLVETCHHESILCNPHILTRIYGGCAYFTCLQIRGEHSLLITHHKTMIYVNIV